MAPPSRPIQQAVGGRLFTGAADGVLLLDPEGPPAVYLRFALVTLGPEEEIFPAFVLDDWGNEIAGPRLYAWIRQEGERFPRAELFGLDAGGRLEQCFLRELELHVKLPCYATLDPAAGMPPGVRLRAIALREPGVDPPAATTPPPLPPPLPWARVAWWRASAEAIQALGYAPVPPS